MPTRVDLSILIVNFNGCDFLGACFDSIKKNVSVSHEIIVVDNASSDGSVSFIRQNYPNISVVASTVNAGYTCGNNLAAKHAVGRYLLLLNNDTVVRSPIAPLFELMDSRRDVGVLGCRIFYGDGRQQESVGYIPSVLSLVLSWTPLMHIFPHVPLFRRTVWAGESLYSNAFIEAEWVSGAFLLTRADIWRELGGLDERYFMYMEDTDYCRQVGAAGYVVAYSASCEITHFEGAGRSWLGERAILNSTHSYLVYSKKYYGAMGRLFLRLLLPPVFFVRAIAHGVLGILGVDSIGLAKARAYGRATLKLIGVLN